jgi:hypothetical protein
MQNVAHEWDVAQDPQGRQNRIVSLTSLDDKRSRDEVALGAKAFSPCCNLVLLCIMVYYGTKHAATNRPVHQQSNSVQPGCDHR